jgi:hypothetical protein
MSTLGGVSGAVAAPTVERQGSDPVNVSDAAPAEGGDDEEEDVAVPVNPGAVTELAVVIVMDLTSSMQPYLDTARAQVRVGEGRGGGGWRAVHVSVVAEGAWLVWGGLTALWMCVGVVAG